MPTDQRFQQTNASNRPTLPTKQRFQQSNASNKAIALLIIAVGLATSSSGCFNAHESESTSDCTTACDRFVVNAGIIFDRDQSYFCIPVERIHPQLSEAESWSSSCDCVRPSIVWFKSPSGQAKPALRIDFVPDTRSLDQAVVSSLSVEIVAVLPDNRKQIVEVVFLSSTFAEVP
jgi:hypothetical protein